MLTKPLAALVIISVVLVMGCTNQDSMDMENVGDDAIGDYVGDEAQPGQGCDGVCDSFEREHPESPCYSDCSGLEQGTQPGESGTQGGVSVTATGSFYASTSEKPQGWFSNHQAADIMLSGFGFNDAGGPLMFNHQGGIASDGEHLILADRNNNRVLIWNSLPTGNQEPDMVLGQNDFITNNPGNGLDELNWPISVATDGARLLVADTYNNRILIWNTFPTSNKQPADISLQGSDDPNIRGNIAWPWAVWTDGERMIVASTISSQVLIWNTIPVQNNQEPDVIIKLDDFGTPRSIGSDGTNLVVGDHNAIDGNPGNFFWSTFPVQENQKYDFFMRNAVGGDPLRSEIMWGPIFTEDGKLVLVSDKLYIWNSFPVDENDSPDIAIGSVGGGYDFGGTRTGDGSSIVYVNGKLYISMCNGNRVVGYNSLPESPQQIPDFVIGSPDIETNTLETEFIISNPVPATDGKSLFVSSDFDRKLYVWKSIPDESDANPDYVYILPDAPWDNALHGNTLALAGKQTLYIWEGLPLNGELPDRVFSRSIGSVAFQELSGVAMDDGHFYLADNLANSIYVWDGIPGVDSEPVFVISTQAPSRISSDGEYFVVTSAATGPGGSVTIYKIDEMPGAEPAVVSGMFNLPQGVLVYDNHLFVADTNFNAVHIWENIEDAISGKEAETFLGEKGRTPGIGKDKLFWPAALAFDGSYLWVGEFKFSERLLRFSVK